MALAHLKDEPWTTALPDEDWQEVKQGVPSKDEAFIKQYLSGREALIGQEKQQRSGKSSHYLITIHTIDDLMQIMPFVKPSLQLLEKPARS
jgi:hypothetical protein